MRSPAAAVHALLLAATLGWPLGAQQLASTTTVRGIAYDSLRSRPLAGALVSIEALGRSAISDSLGGFFLDSVPAGRHELVLQHEMLDSLGLPEPRLAVEVPVADRVVRIATPSFSTLWRATCGGNVPNDSGFVFGVVRDAREGTPVAGVDVRASWVDVGFDEHSGVRQERLGGSIATDERGRYRMCGVPNSVQLTLRARLGDAHTDNVSLFHVAPGVTRRDFLLASRADSALRGIVSGVVRGAALNPVPNALVQWPGAGEDRTDALGRFLLNGVLIGTRSLTVRSIGAQPMQAIADVPWGDTAHVDIVLHNIPTLEAVEVIGSLVTRRFVTDLEERKRVGIAKFVDSTRVARLGWLSAAVTNGSNARLTKDQQILFGARNCQPGLWIDRRYVPPDEAMWEMRLINPEHVGTIEIYERRGFIPLEYAAPNGFADCMILVWTKRNFP